VSDAPYGTLYGIRRPSKQEERLQGLWRHFVFLKSANHLVTISSRFLINGIRLAQVGRKDSM
jgi:hypothetical protein